MSVRFDPSQSVEEIQAALARATETAWGSEAMPEMSGTIELTARALWRLSQEPLEPSDVEP